MERLAAGAGLQQVASRERPSHLLIHVATTIGVSQAAKQTVWRCEHICRYGGASPSFTLKTGFYSRKKNPDDAYHLSDLLPAHEIYHCLAMKQ